MAEFLTKEDGDKYYGTKGKTNAGLTLGIIGTALAALNNNGCNNGILGGILGGNNCAMQQAQEAKTMAMLQGQAADNLSWSNRVASMTDTANLASNLEPRLTQLNNTDWINRIESMKDTAESYAATSNKIDNVEKRLSDQVQILTNQSWMRREQDLNEKSTMYVRSMEADQALSNKMAQDKFDLYKASNDADRDLDNKFTRMNYEGRIQDLNEKFDMFTKLSGRICELEKEQAKTQTALPLMFELTKVNGEKYTDACCCQSKVNLLTATNNLQRQLDHKIDGELKYSYSDLCAPVPSISPLYCSPFTNNGSCQTL